MKNVPGYEGDYKMDSDGRVWSFKRSEPRVLKETAQGQVTLYRDTEKYRPVVSHLYSLLYEPEAPALDNCDLLSDLFWDYGGTENEEINKFLKRMLKKLSTPSTERIEEYKKTFYPE